MSFPNIPTPSAAVLNKAAAIDIGSNTLRLLIANIEGNRLLPIVRDREIVRLGRNFYPERILTEEARDRALRVLGRFRRQIDEGGAAALRVAGTGVLREAANIDEFTNAVRQETDLSLEVISGEKEAGLSARGVLSVFPGLSTRTCIFDLGGGSAEFVSLSGDRWETAISLPLGVVGLTELFLPSDPPEPAEIKRLQAFVLEILMKNIQSPTAPPRLIGTAGTVTTLAAMEQGLTGYDPDRINGSVLDRGVLDRLLSQMAALPWEQRSRLAGLEPGRSDIIVAGLAVVLTVMLFFKAEELWVSDAGLLEGMLLENPAGRLTAGY
jgi:exopolyphosphatase/guanosine-5'-triphosphate,3'-diphosphate pyrophosphatase